MARDSVVAHLGLAPIAATHGVTIPQVLLRWHLQHGHVVLPKTVKLRADVANLDVLGFTLSPKQAVVVGEPRSEYPYRRGPADPRTFVGS